MMNNSTCTVTYCPLVSHAVSFRIQQQGRAVKLKVDGRPMADSCGCSVETNRILQSNYPSVKNKLKFFKSRHMEEKKSYVCFKKSRFLLDSS